MAGTPRTGSARVPGATDVPALVRAGLERSSGPRFEAVADALREAISSGVIGRGAKLPRERELAQRSGVGRVTVARSYDLLRRDGWVHSRTGSGAGGAAGVSPSAE